MICNFVTKLIFKKNSMNVYQQKSVFRPQKDFRNHMVINFYGIKLFVSLFALCLVHIHILIQIEILNLVCVCILGWLSVA